MQRLSSCNDCLDPTVVGSRQLFVLGRARHLRLLLGEVLPQARVDLRGLAAAPRAAARRRVSVQLCDAPRELRHLPRDAACPISTG